MNYNRTDNTNNDIIFSFCIFYSKSLRINLFDFNMYLYGIYFEKISIKKD